MPSLLRPRVWTSQPQYPVGIDWSNPITRGLSLAFNATCPESDLVGNTPLAIDKNGIATSQDKYGRFLTFSGAGTGKFQYSSQVDTEQVSVFWIGNHQSRAANARLFSTYNGAGSTGRWDLYLPVSTSTVSIQFQQFRATTAGQWKLDGVGTLWQATTNNVFGITYDGSSTANVPTFYENGKQSATGLTVIAAPVGALSASSGVAAVGGRPDITTGQLQGGISVLYKFNRVLSASEMKSLAENPWQIFAPQVT